MQYRSGSRYLRDPKGRNISFEYDESRPAIPTDSADLEVKFEFVSTKHPGGVTRLDFWRYDEELAEWIYDSEVRQGQTKSVTKMQSNLMLVLDNSSSLKEDFVKVKDAAIKFVDQLYRSSNEQGVVFRIGVIGFSTIEFTKVRGITPLDADNYNEIIAFIRGLEMRNGTALYYSLEKALDMLDEDTRKNIPAEVYRESRIYAFTDGLDQASIDDSRGLITPTLYYESLRPKMKGSTRRLMANRPKKIVRSAIVTVRGDDMTDGQERQLDQRAQEICDTVFKEKNISELMERFKYLATDLVNSNFTLYCYIPQGASGLVGWTFADDKAKKQPRTPSEKKLWMGLGLDAGFFEYYEGYYQEGHGYTEWYEQCPFLALRTDMAWPITKWFGLGFTASMGLDMTYFEEFLFTVGPLMKFTFNNNSALLLGTNVRTDFDNDLYMGVDVGWKFKSPWYVKAFVGGGDGMSMSLGIGYSIIGGK